MAMSSYHVVSVIVGGLLALCEEVSMILIKCGIRTNFLCFIILKGRKHLNLGVSLVTY